MRTVGSTPLSPDRSVLDRILGETIVRPGNAIRVVSARNIDPVQAVRDCVAQIGAVAPTLLLVFCGGKHDPRAIRDALHAAYGGVAIVGGSAAGTIGAAGGGYSGLELTIAAFVDPAITPLVMRAADMTDGDERAGADLGAQIASVATEGAVVMLMFDNVEDGGKLRLHSASRIIGGLEAQLGGKRITLIGAGMLTDMNLSDGWVFTGPDIARHVAVALVFPPTLRASTVVLHGCRPVSTFMEITRIEGAEVFELDGQPALAIIEQMLHLPLGGSGGHDLTLIATLGEKQGDPFLPYDENAYVNRLIISSDPASGSVTLFEPDFHVGTKVQIMSRDNSLMLQSVRDGVAAANRAEPERLNVLNLYIDCAGRASARSGSPIEEADLVAEGLNPETPLVGFYSGVEIAPFDGYSRPLDWTGVLTTFSRDAA